jgi:hypothetical protein
VQEDRPKAYDGGDGWGFRDKGRMVDECIGLCGEGSSLALPSEIESVLLDYTLVTETYSGGDSYSGDHLDVRRKEG